MVIFHVFVEVTDILSQKDMSLMTCGNPGETQNVRLGKSKANGKTKK